MSPASRSKSKEKKVAKEPQKASSKPPGPVNTGSGVPATAYNPLSETFHTIETSPISSAPLIQTNGRFHNIDEIDDHLGVSNGAGADSDSVSNNGSWSGESEDQKEKTSGTPVRQDAVPGADNDKREKIRQKNEKKHQRQKERRAQELHERCCVYIMSRKLEARVQQLVSMGFSHERSTAALMLNEGKLEESIAWLFEAGDDVDKYRDHNVGGGNLKIDISEELARISDMEIQYKFSKLEVERAVVASEGDLDKAADSLSALKLEPPTTPLMPEETGDPPMVYNGKVSFNQNVGTPLPRHNPTSMVQVRRDDRDFNYRKASVPVLGSAETGSKGVQPLKRIPPKVDWAKPPQAAVPAEKRWPNAGSNPSVSSSLASPLQVSPLPAKSETHFLAAGSEYKNLQPTIREPVIVMQRPQSVNIKQVPATSISSSPQEAAASWFSTASGVDIMRTNGLMPHIHSTVNPSPSNPSSNQMFHQLQYQQQQHFVPCSSPRDSSGTSRGNGLWSGVGPLPTLSAASSLGLFTGLGVTGSSGASSPVDWSTAGTMTQFDYTNIDWSLDRGGSSSPRTNGFWHASGSFGNGSLMYDSGVSALGAKLASWSTPSGNGVPVPALQNGGVPSTESSSSGSREWSSPFEGKDLFSVPRRFVSSPSL